jgi:acyl-CoA synthetase (AMP-forming)/AMP-acid ligase II
MASQPFPISPRNTAAAVVHLLMKTSCHHLLTTRTTLKDLLDGVKVELEATNPSYQLVIEEVPALHDVFPKLGVEANDDPFTPFKADYKPKLDEIAMYLHSSGSTGLPKAIPLKHQTLLDWTSICESFHTTFLK